MELKDNTIITMKLTYLRRAFTFLAIVVGLSLAQGCSYSFTGASISPSVKSISVAYLPNNALLVQPTLSRKPVSYTHLDVYKRQLDFFFVTFFCIKAKESKENYNKSYKIILLYTSV